MAREKLNVEITATDRASGKIDAVADKIETVEGEHTVVIDADDNATTSLTDVQRIVDSLQAEQVRIATSATDGASADLDRIESEVRSLDGDTARFTIEARNNASADIDRVESELRALDGETATVKVDANTSSLGGLSGSAKGAVAGLGLGAAFVAGAQDASRMVLEVDSLANLTGASLEDASRLAGVFANSNVEAKDLADIMLNVNQVLRDNPDLAAQLGVQIGGDTSLIETFVQTVDSIATAFDEPSARAAEFSRFFGEEGARQVNDVVTAIDTDLATALAQFDGPIITDESVDNARDLNKEVREVKQNLEKISVETLPVINGLLEGIIGYFSAISEAGGDFRRTLLNGPGWFDGPDDPTGDLNAVIDENTSGFHGGAPIGPSMSTAPRGGPSGGGNVTIYNPPGTPATTAEAARRYATRNGNRFS